MKLKTLQDVLYWSFLTICWVGAFIGFSKYGSAQLVNFIFGLWVAFLISHILSKFTKND